MSSYLQNDQVDTDESSPLGQGPFPCPECGQISLVWVTGDCTLLNGTVVPNLKRLKCSSCLEDFFDHIAMGVIEAYRRKIDHKDANIRKRKKHNTKVV